ncbi:MAG: hypothetical protein LAO77_07120 [Acidobacteriia bacterium]|nr:hypothetical protein [Terriglobia bacterium]
MSGSAAVGPALLQALPRGVDVHAVAHQPIGGLRGVLRAAGVPEGAEAGIDRVRRAALRDDGVESALRRTDARRDGRGMDGAHDHEAGLHRTRVSHAPRDTLSVVRSASASRPLPRLGLFLVLALLAAWGLRLTILEGFVYEWPRGFRGDFHGAMWEADWWDGRGIMYGPLFVIERWLVNAWPRVFTVYFFALADIPAVVLAFVFSLRAVRATRTTAFVAFTAWCCYRWLFYAFSVAANPEILELLFLTIAWYAASRARETAAWLSAALATLTKVIPVIFAPVLLLRASRRAIAVTFVAIVVIAAAVGVGQRMSPAETMLGLLIPSQSTAGGSLRQATHIIPIPSNYQIVGLNTAVARAMGMTDTDPRLATVQTITNVVTAIVYLWCAFVAFLVLQGRHALLETTRLALAYGLFFALMPLATFHTHPHTFVFMLPVWTAIIATLGEDGDRRRATAFGGAFVVLFVFGGMPSVATPFDRVLHTHVAPSLLFADPIWANVITVLTWSGYALLRTRDLPAPV